VFESAQRTDDSGQPIWATGEPASVIRPSGWGL